MSSGPAGSPVGLLCNPLGGRVRRRLQAVRRAASALPGAVYLEATDAPGIAAALRELAGQGAAPLVVIGGDGTVHAAFTELFGNRPFKALPPIAVIPAGTTNMTASSLGIRGTPADLIRRLGARLEGGIPAALPRQHVLRVGLPAQRDRYGMFFGAGIIARGVKYFHERVGGLGVTGESASGIVVMRFVLDLLMRGGLGSEEPLHGSLRADGSPGGSGDWLMLLASTLDRMILGLRPYWGAGSGPIHATAVRANPRRLWHSLLPLLTGRGKRLNEADGYWSIDAQRVELELDGDFIIDGELYKAESRKGPICISAAECFGVLRPES